MNYGSFKPTLEGKRFKADQNASYRTFLFPIALELKATPTPDASFKPYGFVGAGLLAWDLRDESDVDKSFF
jgi:hypothetical protein